MDATAVRKEIEQFIRAYGNSFSQGAHVVCGFYSEPCVTARAGVVWLNRTRRDLELLFDKLDKDYRARGFTHGALVTMEVKLLGFNK